MRLIFPLVLVSLLALFALGCGESPSGRRTWQPEDHGQPSGPESDPSRQAPRAEPTRAVGPEVSRARAASALFEMMCASCHGLDGKGGGAELPAGAAPPDFTDASFHRERTDAQLIDVIRQGRGMMPAFSEQISDEGLEALIAHLRRFDASSGSPP